MNREEYLKRLSFLLKDLPEEELKMRSHIMKIILRKQEKRKKRFASSTTGPRTS